MGSARRVAASQSQYTRTKKTARMMLHCLNVKKTSKAVQSDSDDDTLLAA